MIVFKIYAAYHLICFAILFFGIIYGLHKKDEEVIEIKDLYIDAFSIFGNKYSKRLTSIYLILWCFVSAPLLPFMLIFEPKED
jgi:hypothetical protein